VQTLIDLARRLGIQDRAEWVQDEESASMLRDWGCDYIQGRLIGLASRRPEAGRRQAPRSGVGGREPSAAPGCNRSPSRAASMRIPRPAPIRRRSLIPSRRARSISVCTKARSSVNARCFARRRRPIFTISTPKKSLRDSERGVAGRRNRSIAILLPKFSTG